MARVPRKLTAGCGLILVVLFLLHWSVDSHQDRHKNSRNSPGQHRRKPSPWQLQAQQIPISGDILRNNIPEQFVSLIALCRRLQAKGTLLLTFVNEAYLPFTYNFLCHTAHFDVHDRMIILVDGVSAKTKLEENWPGVHVISVTNVTSEDQSEAAIHPGNLKYGTAGYVRMMAHRTKILNVLVQHGFSFFLFETDFVWLTNPLPDFLQRGMDDDLDFIGTISSDPTENNLCGAFIYFRNTLRTRLVWEKVTDLVAELEREISEYDDTEKAPPRRHEQIFLNTLLKNRYSGVRFGVVDYTSVMDGRWYQMPREMRRVLKVKAIHNNFIIGNAEKIQRARQAGHWVLNGDLSCNVTKATELSKVYRGIGLIADLGME